MKHSKIKLIMTLCLLVLGLGQANAQNINQDDIVSFNVKEFRTGANGGGTFISQGYLDNSGWSAIKFSGNYEPTQSNRYNYCTQILTGCDGSWNYAYQRFAYSCVVPAYTRVKVGFANGQIHLYNLQTSSNVESATAVYIFPDENTAKYTALSCNPTAARPADPANGQLCYYAYNSGKSGACAGSTKYNTETYFDNSTGAAQTTITKGVMLTTCAKNGPREQRSHLLLFPVNGKHFTLSYEYFKHITYYPNGGVGESKTQTVSSASPSTLFPASTYTRKNHIFKGWTNDAAGNNHTPYAGGIGVNASIDDKGTRTLYAQWTPVQFTFKNGNAIVGSPLSAQSNNSLPSLNAGTYKPTNGDKLFVGYFTEPEGRGIQVYDGSLQPTTAGNAESFGTNTTLYAYFIPTQHNVIFDYSFRTDESTYATLSDKIYTYRLQFKDAHGNALKTVELTAPEATTRETASMTDAIDTHTTSNMLVTLKVKEGSESDILSGENPTIYFDTQAELERVHSFQYDVWNTTEPAGKAVHWETETNEDTNTTIFKYTGYHEGNMFTLSWTVTLHDLAMYPEKIYAKPMVKNDGGTFAQISPMNGVTGLECLRTELASNGSSATYTGEYAVLRTQSAGTAEYKVGMTGFYLDGSDYFLNSTHGTVPDDFVSSTPVTSENASISYDIYDYDIPVVLLVAGASDAKVNHQDRELYVDQARETHVNLSQFVAERLHFNFLGWYDTEWIEDGVNKVWAANADYQFHTHHESHLGGTRTLIAQWRRDSKPEASVEMTEEANSFDYTITATDAVEVKAVKYMTADEEPAADNTNWVAVEKNNDKYVVSINRENDKYGKYLYVMVENEGQYVIEKYEDPIRSFIDITANPDPDSEVKMGHYEGEGDNAQWVEDDNFSYTYYSTYFNSTQAFKPVNATAYKVIAVNENTLRLANITTTENDGISTAAEEGDDDIIAPQGELILPKGEAVILQGSSAKITLELVDSDVTKSADNKLEGVDDETSKEDAYNYYKLTYAQKGLGFYKMSAGDRLGAHKAFFKKDNDAQSNSVQAFTLNFGDIDNDLTAITIREMEATDNADTTFDLFGRKVSKANMQSGIYVNGVKKVIK